MIKNIITDTKKLSIKCISCLFIEKDQKENKQIINDLIDTANAHKKDCVGLAANQINYNKRIVVILLNNQFISFINPVIMPLRTTGVKSWWEGCLSFPDRKQIKTRRFKKIKVKYNMLTGEEKIIVLKGFQAAIMQHETDHLDGIIQL